MERIAPGACTTTYRENKGGMRCLFQHGRDPSVGMKPLGPIRELEEDKIGGRYEVDLLNAGYVRELLPGLRSSQYGASFRFRVLREEVDPRPRRSAHNPEGIEERTITEMQVREFGPVTFPAYSDATAAVRSGEHSAVATGNRQLLEARRQWRMDRAAAQQERPCRIWGVGKHEQPMKVRLGPAALATITDQVAANRGLEVAGLLYASGSEQFAAWRPMDVSRAGAPGPALAAGLICTSPMLTTGSAGFRAFRRHWHSEFDRDSGEEP